MALASNTLPGGWKAGKLRGAKARRLEGRGSDAIFKLIECLNFRHVRHLPLLSHPDGFQ